MTRNGKQSRASISFLTYRSTTRGYRIPFALQWIFPPIIGVGAVFAPESPWWCVRNGHMEQAAKVVKRLLSKKEAQDPNIIQNKVSEMRLTNEHEKALSAGTQYWDCFRGIDLRRTECATFTWAVQNLCGSAFMGFSTCRQHEIHDPGDETNLSSDFYKQAGLPTSQAFNLSIAQYALGMIGTIGSWVLM